jgi:hypothetical protein
MWLSRWTIGLLLFSLSLTFVAFSPQAPVHESDFVISSSRVSGSGTLRNSITQTNDEAAIAFDLSVVFLRHYHSTQLWAPSDEGREYHCFHRQLWCRITTATARCRHLAASRCANRSSRRDSSIVSEWSSSQGSPAATAPTGFTTVISMLSST